jgi:hypothetical protein
VIGLSRVVKSLLAVAIRLLLKVTSHQSASEALRRIIGIKLSNRSLPSDGIPSTIPGRPGDGSVCAACIHTITSRDLMMVISRHGPRLSVPNEVRSIRLHADCFELWNEERRMFKPSP